MRAETERDGSSPPPEGQRARPRAEGPHCDGECVRKGAGLSLPAPGHHPADGMFGPPRSLRVLIVDDNHLIRRLLALIVEGAGFEAIETESGEDALVDALRRAVAARRGGRPDHLPAA